MGETDHYQLRARLGADVASVLTYITLGITKAELTEQSIDASGLTYGVGTEYLVNENFSEGLEYSLNNFDEITNSPGVEVNIDLLQLRASYRF